MELAALRIPSAICHSLVSFQTQWHASSNPSYTHTHTHTHTHALYLLFLVEKPRAKLCATLPQGTMSATCSECLV